MEIEVDAPLTLSGAITGNGSVRKTSNDVLRITGTDNVSDPIRVEGGTLLVDGPLSATPVALYGGTLGGTGTVASVGSSQLLPKTLNPGENGPGILNARGVILDQYTTLVVELNGGAPGTGYDQLNVTGGVNLASCSLKVSLGFTPAVGSSFTIIKNDFTDQVLGTFQGLPEGALFETNGIWFAVSYTGAVSGNDVKGNDVVLTRVNTPMKLSSILASPGGPATIQGAGVTNGTVTIQASTNLVSWTNIGSVYSTGSFSFTDTNAPAYPYRFYRTLAP
jgi:hypothetical protein